MKPTVSVDIKQWQKAARELHETSSRTMVDFINGQSLKVAALALKHTISTAASKIERELGALARKVEFKKLTRGARKGKMATRRGGYVLAGNDTLAHRILAARKASTGTFGIAGNTDDERAENLIKQRLRSAHFIRSGWVPVISYFASIVRKKPEKTSVSRGGARVYGKPKGRGIAAKLSVFGKVFATIENTALNAKVVPPSKSGNPLKVATEGLRKALDETARDMIETLKKRLEPDFKKVSAK